jgi:phosphonate transport system substrate-binding protein
MTPRQLNAILTPLKWRPRVPARVRPAVRFGFTRAHGGERLHENARRFASVVEALLEQPVKLVIARDYEHLLEGLLVGGIDLAWMPPLLHARAASGLLAAVSERDGALVYRAALLVRAESEYQTIPDLRGARAAWSDPSSASGCVFPRLHLHAAGFDLSRLRGETFFGSPASAMTAVIEGQADLCACPVREGAKSDTDIALADIYRTCTKGAWRLRVVAVTEPIPPDGFVLAPTVDDSSQARIRDALLVLHERPEGAYALRGFLNADRLAPVAGSVMQILDRLRTRVTGEPKD